MPRTRAPIGQHPLLPQACQPPLHHEPVCRWRAWASRLALWLVLAAGAVALPGRAQGIASIYDEQQKLVRGDGQVAPLNGDLFGDKISLYSGALEFVQADFSIPGNSALPVAVARRFVTGRLRVAAEASVTTGIFGDWDLEIPHLSGVFATGAGNQGWAAGGTTMADRYQRCSLFGAPPDGRPNKGLSIWEPHEFWAGNSLYVPGQGAQEVLIRSAENSLRPSDGRAWPLVTKGGWQLGCLPTLANGMGSGNRQGEGFLALAPDGTQYRFDWMAERPMPSMVKNSSQGTDRMFRAEVWLMPTRITDRFGNSVTLTFNPAQPWQLLSMVASDGRTVSFDYLPGSSLVSTVIAGGRTWRYAYNGTQLSRVTLPDGAQWQYRLGPLAVATRYRPEREPDCETPGELWADPVAGEIVHPSGARGVFNLESRIHARSKVPKTCLSYAGGASAWYAFHPRHFPARSITSKALFGPGLPAAGLRTAYSYSAASASWADCSACGETKTVEVTDARGVRTRHTFGTRFGVNDGQLLQVDEGWNGSSAVRTTTHRYRATDAGPYPAWLGDADQLRNDPLQGEQHAPLESTVISQQGMSFRWQAKAFDPLARATSVVRSSGLGDSREEVTTYHDHLGLWVLGQVAQRQEPASGLLMEDHAYDPATAQRIRSFAFGRLTGSWAYNADGTLQAAFDPASRRTGYTNHKRGLAQGVQHPDGSTESAVVDDWGLITRHTNEAGSSTDYAYDGMGRLARVTPPAGDAVAYHPTVILFEQRSTADMGLDAGHWRQTVTHGNAITTRYFDALWRLRLTRRWDTTNEAGTRRVVQQHWDANGRKTFESYPQRDITGIASTVPGTRWDHDAIGRVIGQHQDSELGLLTTRTDYLAAFVKQVTNPRGVAMRYRFQAFDTPSEDSIRQIAGPRGLTVDFDRDVFGKALAITRTGLDGGSATRRYAYDQHQRLCMTIEPETGATLQGYDSADNLAWRASGLAPPSNGQCGAVSVPPARTVSFGYDTRNRLIATTYGDGSPAVGRSYTPDGLPWKLWTAGNVWTYAYNNRRLLVTEVLGFEGFGWRFDHGIDAYGRVSSLKYPDGAVVAQPTNALGEPTQITGYAERVSHHPNGTLAGYTLGNGVAHTSVLNLRGLPQQLADSGLVHDRYSYDNNGNVEAIIDQATGTRSRTMAYDELDRLTVANGIWGAGTYRYDALDNLRGSTVGARSLQHNIDVGTNRLTSLSGSQSVSIAYDALGNVVRRGAQTFAFDIGNRLRSATGKASYTYDGHGRRMLTTYADGSRKLQLYGLDGKLLYTRQTNQGGTRHVYLGSKLIAETHSVTGTTYVHTDALGSPVARSHPLGGLISRTDYEPYGNFAGGVNPTNVGFTGHVNDADTGLVYMQQRYYDPIAGRFLSVDPVTTDAKTGRSSNRFAYVENNPYKYFDPDGRELVTVGVSVKIPFVGGATFSAGVSYETGNWDGGIVVQSTGLVPSGGMLVGKAAVEIGIQKGDFASNSGSLSKNVEAGIGKGGICIQQDSNNNLTGAAISFGPQLGVGVSYQQTATLSIRNEIAPAIEKAGNLILKAVETVKEALK